MNRIYVLLIAVVLISCDRRSDIQTYFRSVAYKPVYSKSGSLKDLIKSVPTKSLDATGKIYIYKQYLLVVEPWNGVHIFDNSNPAKPIKLTYISIPGANDVALKGNYLYADFLGRIAVIDIQDIYNPILKQDLDLGNYEFRKMPPKDPNSEWDRIYFECVDPTKGEVIGWVPTTYDNSIKCYRN